MASSRGSQRSLRPFCVRHHPAARQPDDGSGRHAMPPIGGVLRGSDAPAAQHPLVRGVGLRFLQPSSRPRTVLAQSPDPRLDCPALRTVASTARAAEPYIAGPALSTNPLLTAPLR